MVAGVGGLSGAHGSVSLSYISVGPSSWTVRGSNPYAIWDAKSQIAPATEISFEGRDGVVGAVRVTGPDAVTAEFARYTTKDTECCPASRVRVTYRIERAGPQPTLVPLDIRTLR